MDKAIVFNNSLSCLSTTCYYQTFLFFLFSVEGEIQRAVQKRNEEPPVQSSWQCFLQASTDCIDLGKWCKWICFVFCVCLHPAKSTICSQAEVSTLQVTNVNLSFFCQMCLYSRYSILSVCSSVSYKTLLQVSAEFLMGFSSLYSVNFMFHSNLMYSVLLYWGKANTSVEGKPSDQSLEGENYHLLARGCKRELASHLDVHVSLLDFIVSVDLLIFI